MSKHEKHRVEAAATTPEGLESPAMPEHALDEKHAAAEPRLNFTWVVDAVLYAFQAQFEAFRTLLAMYVNQLAVSNAWGVSSTIDMCRLCSGGGIHNMGCACPCHPARKLLAQIDEAKARTQTIITLR